MTREQYAAASDQTKIRAILDLFGIETRGSDKYLTVPEHRRKFRFDTAGEVSGVYELYRGQKWMRTDEGER